MKKVLLASTVLALSATVAAAEVSVSGSARMGLVYDGNAVSPATSKVLFTSRVRVVFSMSGETDGGLSFGASVRNDQSGQGNTRNGDSKVFISGAFGKLTFGDNDSAANALVGHVAATSLTGLGDNNELGYLGQSKTSVLYEYSAGALSFAASVGQRNIAGVAAVPATFTPAVAAIADEAMSVAVKYSADTFSASLGYEDTKTDSQVSVGLGASFSGVDLKLVAMDRKSLPDTHWAISAGYKMDALGVTAFYADKGPSNAYGLGASYDLGGGATLVGGLQKVKGAKVKADLGVSMSF
jgi:outer membrane protein OmpU